MLEKMLDLKNTFEGKFLAVLMSVVLVMSMTNILAFAGNEGQKDGSKTESAPTDQVVGESDKEAVDEAVQHGESAAAKDADASKTTPSQPLVSTTVDEAVVTFETQNAFVSVKDQLLSGTMLTTELHKELRFTASADTGFELGAITAKNAANADVPVTTQDGVSSIAAEYVDSTLVVSVVAAAVVSDEPEVETTPITSDTKIEPGEADEKGEPEEPKSEEPETDEPEAPVADEDVVEVEADVSNPAFEGYAQAGNVLVKVTAAEGVLPEGATVQATRIERQDVVDAVAERVESQGKVLEDAIAIDVTLLDKDGNEIQPNGALNVCFFDANVEGEEVGVYRVSDDASQVETIGARQADPAVQSFDVDHFTIYVATGSNYASTGIKLDSSSIEVGETIKALGERKWNSKGYSWTSSDASVAKVAFSKENRADIVGVSPGVATITYSYKVGNRTYTDTAKVHVVPSVVKHTVSWYVNGDVSKSTKVRDGEVPSYGGTPNRAGDWQYKQFVGWATAPNSKNYLTEGELPAVTEDVSYYAVFTSQAYFYFVLEGRSNTSTVAKDYMYAGEGTMIVPDGFNSGDRWYDGSNFSIADYIVSTPSDEAIRNGIRAAYADYSPDWTYTIDWTTLSVAGSSVDYRYNTFDYGKSMHTDGALSINKDTTIGVTYLTQKPDGSVVTNSTSHDKNVAFGLNSTVNTDAPSFETDGYTYNSRVNHNGASYVFDGWYLDQSYTTKAPDSVSPSSSASFYARYIANTKTLTYQANGGAFSDGTIQDKTAVQQVGARVSFISNPSRDGYVFTGWKDKDTGDVYSAGVSGMIMPDRDVTLVAQWQGVIPIKLLGDETKKTYSGTKQSYTGFTVSGLDMGSYTVSGVQALAQGTDVGTYKGTIDYSGMRIFEKSSGSDVTNQFEVVEASEPTLIVEKAPISIVTPDDSKLYDGAPLIATKGAELSGLVNDETATLIVIGSRTDVGTSDNAYQIDWSGSAKESNYFIDEETIGTLEIAKRPVTVTAKGGEKQYDGKPLTAADTGYDIGGEGLVEGHEADVALSGSQTAPGASPATVESVAVKDGDVDVANNYDVATADGSLKVTNRDAKYEVTLKANSSTGNVYDGTEKSAKGVVTDRFVIDDVEYAVSGYETQDPAEVAAGVYTNNVSGDFKVKDPAGNDVTSEFAVHTEDGELEIAKRPVTVTAKGGEKQYDGKPLTAADTGYDIGGEGLVEGHEADVALSGSQTAPGASPATVESVAVKDGDVDVANNYDVATADGSLKVTNRDAKYEVTLKANSSTGNVYDGTEKSAKGVVTDRFVIDDVEYAVSGYETQDPAEVAAGVYTNNVSGDFKVKDPAGNDVTSEFAVHTEDGELEIAKRPVTVTAKGGEKQYDGKPLTAADTGYDIGGEGLVEGHEADVALSGSQTAPGASPATVESVAVKDGDVDVANNYDVATADGSLKVTNRDAKYEVTLKANSSTGNVYDGTEKSAKGVVTDRFVIDDVEYAVSGYETQDPAEVAAGVYTNNVSGDFKVKDPAGNDVTSEFAVHTEDGELEILPREVTLASGSATKIYDGTALELPDVTVGGDGFVGTEASVRATGSITDIGGPIDNTIVVEPGEGFIAANYNVVYTVGKLTVTSASIDPDDPSYTGIQINNPYDVQYNGQEQRWIPSVFDRNNHKLVTGTDYTVSYSQDVRNVGVVTVTITGIGNYMGTVERAYNITPAPAVIRVNDSSKAYGEADPGFTGAVEGLFGDDLLGDIAYSRTNIDEEVGNYSDVLTATVGNLNGNYTYTVEPGNFSIVPAGGNVVTIDATGLTKTYDGQPVSVVAEASVDGSALLYSVDGSTWSDANPEFTNAGTYTVYVKATHDGYEESAPVSATVVINPAPVTIAVADASKVAGADDPAFSGTVEGLVAEGDLGDINYVRPGGEEAAGVYVGALTALYTQNGNYRVAVLNGTFTITAAPVTPPTPPTPPTSPTPTPLPTPGTVPPDSPIAPVVTPIVDALQGAAEAVIGDNETPLAEPRETEIGDNDTPLASHDHASCWVHWYIILGIIVTALYGACVALRRGLFSRKLKKYEDGLTGGGDPAPGAPSIGDDASAPIAPKGAPAGATLAAGLGE
ncbi:cell wall/surface repeat protein [Eggerthella lenta DSM 2243]|uniref:Cell wall/surface repeat protein n=6 Tax=Eggerthella TaxID=84111 RepID=C8WJ96_EGGLE|nr:MBG domain-containing protein [Eggerthella lenta]ACV54098.1 cell wall/surface repeat protein [Eggerthella lenta DSM 2243]